MPTVQGTWKLHSHRFAGTRRLNPEDDLVIRQDGDLWTFTFKAGGRRRSPSLESRGPVTEFDLTEGDGADAVTLRGRWWKDTEGRDEIIGLVYAKLPGDMEPSDADVFLAVRTGGLDES
jgi:hypothetical protein